MPGKVNPVMPEVMTQVAAQVIGNDAAIAIGGMQGHFELNVFIPLMARNLLDSIRLLASASRLLAEKCVDGIEANREQCERYAELTLSAATALNPYIGYDKATEIVKEASKSGRSLREVAREAGVEDERARRGARLPRDGEAARRLTGVPKISSTARSSSIGSPLPLLQCLGLIPRRRLAARRVEGFPCGDFGAFGIGRPQRSWKPASS